MIPWKQLGAALTPDDGNEVGLFSRGSEFSIRVSGQELMNSRMFGSEKELARLACKALGPNPGPRVLIGGLGMGFTLAAALGALPENAGVVVAELLPDLVLWNREHLSHLAGSPLDDPRVMVEVGDVVRLLVKPAGNYDAVILDVDNGPGALTQEGNAWLYTTQGLRAIHKVLAPKGVLGVWSAIDSPPFTRRLKECGYHPEVHRVRARENGKGARHTLWIAIRR
ncbi:MAG: hypothetical protein GY737_06420 [Desulfobacteraceae bacterium]|nr:hypothetical protein [Desulfobacteraceae bacterium]